MTPSNRATTTAAVTGPAATTRGGGVGGGPGGPGGGRGNKVRQTMNGIDIKQAENPTNNYEEKQQNGSENVPPAPQVKSERGETKQSTIPPEKMETVSKGTGASKFEPFFKEKKKHIN